MAVRKQRRAARVAGGEGIKRMLRLVLDLQVRLMRRTAGQLTPEDCARMNEATRLAEERKRR